MDRENREKIDKLCICGTVRIIFTTQIVHSETKALHEIKCGNLSKSEIVEKILNIYETH